MLVALHASSRSAGWFCHRCDCAFELSFAAVTCCQVLAVDACAPFSAGLPLMLAARTSRLTHPPFYVVLTRCTLLCALQTDAGADRRGCGAHARVPGHARQEPLPHGQVRAGGFGFAVFPLSAFISFVATVSWRLLACRTNGSAPVLSRLFAFAACACWLLSSLIG